MKKKVTKSGDTLDNSKMMLFPIEQYPFASANKVSNVNFFLLIFII